MVINWTKICAGKMVEDREEGLDLEAKMCLQKNSEKTFHLDFPP